MATYTVEPNDNLSLIANKLGISLNTLKEANPAVLPPEFKIRVGDQLALPNGIKNSVQSNTKETRKSQRSNTDANKANNAAKADFLPREAGISNCPNQKEWITVVPLRYGVQQKHSESFKPTDLKISGLQSLQKHVYVPRPLMPGCVYLYSQKQGYILEAEYEDEGMASSAGCAAGSAPSQAISGTSLQAEKDDTIELLYTPCKLPNSLVTAFQQDTALRKQYFKTVSITSARGEGTSNASPLCKLPNFLTDCKVKPNLFDWSIQSIESNIANSLLAAANASSPDNHIAVVLPDPITITTELALLFDAQYDVAMTSIAKTEHPYQVALVTQQLVNKKGAKAYSRHVSKVQSVSYYGGMVKRRTDDEVEHIRLARKYDAEKDLTEHLNYQQMQDFVGTRKEYTQNLASTLNKEAEDWLKWLKSPELNQALTFFTATEEPNKENLVKLEASLSNMTMNLQVSEKGAQLRNEWADKQIINLSPTQEIASSDNTGWHVLLVLTGKIATEANKVNKEIIDASNIDYANMAKSYSDFFTSQSFKASLATDNLNAVFGERLAQLGIHMKAEAAFLFYMERQSYRYQYSLRTTEMKMGDMLNDIQRSYQANVQQSVGTAPTAIATSVRSSILVKTLDLSKPAPVGKVEKALTPFAKWFVSQADYAGLVQSNAIAVKTVKSAGEAFKPYAGKGLGLLFVGQVYNLFSITQKLSSGKSTNKDIVDLFSALAGITQTSFALLQRGMFKGSEAAFKTASKTMLENVGVTVSSTIKQLKYTNIENIEKTVKTKALTSSDGMLVKFGRAGYKMLPVVGNLIAVISSGFNIHSDFSKDESLLTKTVGIASGVANTLALGCAVVALVSPAAPLVAVAGIVLAVAGIILDIWHSYLQAEELERFLKGSLWGKSDNYEYQKGLSDTGSRLAYFESLTDTEVQKTIDKELTAFCHQLYKPVLTTENYFETHNGRYENFKLNVHLPGFNPSSGAQPYFKLTAKRYGKLTTLYESGTNSLIQSEHKINNTQGKQAIFTQTLHLDETQRKMDFDDYQLELKHQHPAGFPITLHYNIAIDDDSKIPLLTPDVSFDLKRVS